MHATQADVGGNTTIEHISVSTADNGGNELSRNLSMSADGRLIVFVSGATNLTDDGQGGIFVRDLVTQTTERLNVDTGGAVYNLFGTAVISGDGRFVAFEAYTNYGLAVFLHDREAGTTDRVSADGASAWESWGAALNGDGRFVAYLSRTHSSQSPNGLLDVVLYDRITGTRTFVNVSTAGDIVSGNVDPEYGVVISADGSAVAFTFGAALVPERSTGGPHVYVRNIVRQITSLASVSTAGIPADAGYPFRPAISADGGIIAFYSQATNLVVDDTNGMPDAFVRDLETGVTERVSVDTAGREMANGANLADAPAISADGRFVAFVSGDPELSAGDTGDDYDVFLRDRQTGITERVSMTTDAEEANGFYSFGPTVNADASVVAFTSDATNLATNTVPGVSFNVFARIRAGCAAPCMNTSRPLADAYVRGGVWASTNFSGSRTLRVKLGVSADNTRRSYMKFDISDFPTIGKATLRLHGRLSNGTATVRTGIFRVASQTWDEQWVTWNRKPSYGPLLGIVRAKSTTAQWFEIDLTAFLKAEKAGGRSVISLALRALEHTSAYASFDSREAGSLGPQLVITPR
jgi:Tol biopolymer transport system component